MSEQRSLLIHVGEAIDRYRAERESHTKESQSDRLYRRGWLWHWFIPNGGTLLLVIALILTANVWARPLVATQSAPGPSATTVNYQGRLADNLGSPLDGNYGMSFALYDAASAGNLVWGPEVHDAVPVSAGLFSVGLGSRTPGGIPTTTWNGDRYLEITVGGETLSPRELIRSVPIAGMALTVPDGAIGSSQIADGAVETSHIADGAITLDKLAEATVSVSGTRMTGGYWTSPECDGTYRLISNLSIDVTIDTQATLFANYAALGHNSSAGGYIYTGIFVNNAQKGSIGGLRNNTDSGGGWYTVANSVMEVLEPGVYTIEVRAACNAGEARTHTGQLSVMLFP